MNASETYKIKGHCINCRYSGDIEVAKGELAPIEPGFWNNLTGARIGTSLPSQCPNCGNFSCYSDQ